MTDIDLIGSKAVAQIIELSGLTHFIISRKDSQKNSPPIYDFLIGNSNSKCVEAFNKWASIVENENQYTILLFNKLLSDNENADEEKVLHNRNKEKSLKYHFQLSKNKNQSQNNNTVIDYQAITENALLKQNQAFEERESNRKILALEQKIDALLLNLEEEEEEEELGGENNNNLANLIGVLTKLTGINANTKTPPPTINGVNTLTPEKIKNINTAVKKLAKYDENIDLDLLKLSEIAENNNGTFKMLLNSLRSM